MYCMKHKNKGNYKKDRKTCKNFYNINRKKYSNKEKIQVVNPVNFNKKKRKIDSVRNNRTLIIGFSICGKTYLMNQILLKKHPIYVITKSLNQYSNIKAQTSDEIQPLNESENSTVLSDDMLLSKQESNFDLFFTRGRHQNIDFYYISKALSTSLKILFVIIQINSFYLSKL